MVPMPAWIVINRINKRLEQQQLNLVILRFILALLFGILLSFLFVKNIEGINQIMLSLFFIAILTPLYKSEYLLGYVLGTAFTFGAAIPTIFGAILLGIYAILYHVLRWIIRKFKS